MSPAAYTPGAELSSRDEQSTPPASPSSRPALRASVTSGITPAPITTMSQSSESPPPVITRPTRPSEPSKRSSSSPPWTSIPCSSSTPWKKPPTSRPNWRSRVAVLLHHDRALAAQRGHQRRRHLGPDVAPADQHHPLGLLRVGADRVGVAERAQVVDAVQLAAVGAQPPDVRARGQQGLPEAHLVLVRQGRDPLVHVELHHAGAGEQLDVLLAPPVVGAEEHILLGLLAAEVALRERRPVVGRIELACDEHHGALGPLLAQPAGAVRGGHPAADQKVVDLARGQRSGGHAV